jgi:hypothetical protein
MLNVYVCGGSSNFFPTLVPYVAAESLCMLITNSSDEEIDHGTKWKDELFDAMCKVFDLSDEEKEERRKDFKWYRVVVREEDVY